jgi:hypothetical protein
MSMTKNWFLKKLTLATLTIILALFLNAAIIYAETISVGLGSGVTGYGTTNFAFQTTGCSPNGTGPCDGGKGWTSASAAIYRMDANLRAWTGDMGWHKTADLYWYCYNCSTTSQQTAYYSSCCGGYVTTKHTWSRIQCTKCTIPRLFSSNTGRHSNEACWNGNCSP